MITKTYTKDEEEWKALRHQYIGGSDAAAVVRLNKYVSPFSLWAEKTGKLPPFDGNLATEVGTYLEAFIAKKFEQETGKKVRRERASIHNDKYPFAIANVDRMIVGEDAGLEIKSVSSLSLSRFKGKEYPTNFYVQCVHYLAITGKKRWYLAVLIGNNDFRIYTIERDEEEIAALMKAESDFWYNYVIPDLPPPVDASEATSKALADVYGDPSEDRCDLSSINDDIEYMLDLKLQIKNLEMLVKNCENKIKAEMKDCTYGYSEAAHCSWKMQERTTFDRAAFERAYGHIDLSPFYKTSQTRTFRITKKGE